ncbi:type 1 glutamine amidotransferase [Celeribacter baekdonensis]|uniref:type 1 glutamine amidotransferase n=1 Tax=Celeribacter baekdonensis TaxID=875171 RepID=UPI003A917C8E
MGRTPVWRFDLMKLCILELDSPSDPHVSDFGDYGDMFENWLSPTLPEAQFSRIKLDQTGRLPGLTDYDGYLLSGCRYGVYDAIAWKEDLQHFLRQARDIGLPFGGVCFGHQIIADTFGATVRKSDQGWVVGKETYAGKSAFAVHQDQVLTAPDSAKSVSGSARCPIGRIDYAFPALSVQYHPEFTAPYFDAFLTAWRGNPVPASLVDAALPDLTADLNCDGIAADFARVFRTRGPS